jgi:hypothetical protein
MRKTLYAMVGLLALGVWALPAHAGNSDPGNVSTVSTSTWQGDLPTVSEPIPADARGGRIGAMQRGEAAAYKGTLSGTLIKQSQAATTTWFLYPNACNDRAGGTWSGYTAGPVADSLNSYSVATQNHGYPLEDLSEKEILWHVSDGSDSPDIGTGLSVDGSAHWLWCGKYDPNWLVKSGYPNLTYQILYIDTDLNALNGDPARSGPYTLSWQENVSTECDYDYMWLIGGGQSGGGGRDPIGNSRALLDAVIANGTDSGNEMLIQMTGSQIADQTLSYSAGSPNIVGQAEGASCGESAVPTNWSLSGIPAEYRGLYFVFRSDCLCSQEDGCWPFGHGQVLDNITASDQPGGAGNLYAEQTEVGGSDPFAGTIITMVNGQYDIAARVPPGVGTVWTIQAGNNLPTADFCQPQKALSTDHMFLGADANSHLTLPGEYAAVWTCTFGVPTGTASVTGIFDEYLDLPQAAGMVQNNEYRSFKNGVWSNWVDPSFQSVITGALQAWTQQSDELSEAETADSVQYRAEIECIPPFAVDQQNCQPVQYGIMYDNMRLEVVTGVPAPLFDIFVGQVAQSNFVDGTDPTSVGCSAGQISAGQCWPGVRGSNTGDPKAIHDNFNNAYGDSNLAGVKSGIRRNGMSINWQYGHEKLLLNGKRLTIANGAYNASYGPPMWVYRIYDPATQTWSPWDSSRLDANYVSVSGPDTIVAGSQYSFDWPPSDKYYLNQGGADIGPSVDANLPGVPGWTLNGNTKFSQVPFLPRGTRIQYYFKGVDVNGGVAYQFSTNRLGLETADLPTLPGSSIKAPDIIEFDILPRVYPPGAAGTQVAGRTDSKLLNLDGAYSAWSNGFDPITQALRAMGVRQDRFRLLQGLSNGGNIGGHEYPGQRADRPSDYMPNDQEYGIKDLLASHYNIIIQSSHLRESSILKEMDAHLVSQWWLTDTGINGGDRCILGNGDSFFNGLLISSQAYPQSAEQVNLAQNVFGVASCIAAWTGANTNYYPTIDDRFAGGGPGLAAANTFTYPLDGGCPGPNRFDGLTKIGSSDASNAVFYPGGVTEVAGVSYMTEKDPSGSTDNDRNKALSYAFSLQFIRTAGVATTAANYVHTGVQNRMRVLYKFLTSCRFNTAAATPCWPCPSNPADMSTNWASAQALTDFQTSTYGTLFPIQDYTQATGVELTEAPKVNKLEGNYPNPFNPETAIRFSAATPGKVTIRIFDVAGRLVNTLTKNVTTPGLDEIRWNGKSADGRSMASGLYFYRIRFANGQQSEAKMTMLK